MSEKLKNQKDVKELNTKEKVVNIKKLWNDYIKSSKTLDNFVETHKLKQKGC